MKKCLCNIWTSGGSRTRVKDNLRTSCNLCLSVLEPLPSYVTRKSPLTGLDRMGDLHHRPPEDHPGALLPELMQSVQYVG